MEDPVIIKKLIYPSRNNGYISGEKGTIFVEIKNNKRNPTFRNITSLSIWEIPDDDLGVLVNSAKWKYSSSVLELNDIKMDLLRGDSDASERLEKYDICSNATKDYLLFMLNDSTYLNLKQRTDIINSLCYYFGINWITKNDVHFKNKINGIFIRNSDNDTAEIIINSPKKATLKISDGRQYELRIKEKDGSKYVYDSNSIIDLLVNNFEPKGSILFWYDIKPKKAGNFSTETVVKLYDQDYSSYQDISYPAEISVKESIPKFVIHPKPNKLQVYSTKYPNFFGKKDELEVIYDITYLGGASEPLCKNNTMWFDKPKPKDDGYFYFVDENGCRNDTLGNRSYFNNYSNFYKYETKEILMHIVFPKNGIYTLPGIWINGVHYGLEEEKIEISVDDWIQRNKEKIGWILGFILGFVGIVIGSIYGIEICKYTKEHRCELLSQKNKIFCSIFFTALFFAVMYIIIFI